MSDQSAPTGVIPYGWPLADALDVYLLNPGKDGSNLFMGGVSWLISDPDSTAKLRAMRDMYLSERGAAPGSYANWDALKATDGTTTALIYMRDSLPYEDAKGFIGF